MSIRHYAPEDCQLPLVQQAPRLLRFDPTTDFSAWRTAINAKLRELLGVVPTRVPLDVQVEAERVEPGFVDRRFVFCSEAGADVPCHLLLPKGGNGPYPVVICLQGHSNGMHISLGREKGPGDREQISGGDRDFALQAVRQGYAALVLEQRCFGERCDTRPKERHMFQPNCAHASMVSLLLGRTMIGERVWDVSRAIDALATFPELDLNRIACMGNSGGGTITYFATCLEPRIRVAMPSCYVCTFGGSFGVIDHCVCNYIPGIMRYFEMGDLAGLIAPRPLIVVAGRKDPIFPFPAVQETFATIQQIYAAAGAPERCRLVVGEEGHRFYADAAWPVFRAMSVAAW